MELSGPSPGSVVIGGQMRKATTRSRLTDEQQETLHALVCNQTEFARLTGFTKTQVSALLVDETIRLKGGGIPVMESILSVMNNIRGNRQTVSPVKERIEMARLEKLEIDNAERRGDLIRMADVLDLIHVQGGVMKDLLQRKLVREFPVKTAKLRKVAQIRKLAKELTVQLLTKMQSKVPASWK